MRSRTSTWFETRVRYDKTMEDGQNKKVIEQYVVDAFSFSEAEEFITEEMSHYVSGEFDVKAIAPAAYGEIFFSDYLVQAHSVNGAVKHVDEVMGATMIDYEIAAITETKIMDVFEHRAGKNNEAENKPEFEQ